ncbi:MAG: VanZ family protein [Neobacillus sp.]
MSKRKWWILAAIAWMASIFMATQLPYFTGQNTAKVIEKAVVKERVAVENPGATSKEVNKLNLLVRKSTHVIVFGILALLLYKSMEPLRFSYLLAWFTTTLYAITDEWHQSFVPGRSAAFQDVILDSMGALVALYILFFINTYVKRAAKV